MSQADAAEDTSLEGACVPRPIASGSSDMLPCLYHPLSTLRDGCVGIVPADRNLSGRITRLQHAMHQSHATRTSGKLCDNR
jgi:hypothetical protein